MSALILCACALVIPEVAPTRRLGHTRTRGKKALVAAVPLLVVCVLLKGPGSLIISAVVIVATALWALQSARRQKQSTTLRSHTSTFLGYVIGDLRAGNGMPHALGMAAAALTEDSPAVLADAVRIAAARAAGGSDGADVLIASGNDDLVRIGQLWKIAATHGIPLVSLCENAQRRIDAQLSHAAATHAALQGPKATAVVLSILPIAGIGMGGLLGADPLHFLLGGGIGGVLLIAGTTLTAVGFIWSQRIIAKATS